MPRTALLATLCGLATLAAGCSVPRILPSGSSGTSSGGSSGGGLGALGDAGPRYCTVRPHQFTSWTDPIVVAPNCPYEGWVRQVVRDIGEIEPCLRGQPAGEVRLVLEIDTRGLSTRVSVENPTPVQARTCVLDAVWGWEFASAQSAGELLVVYRPGSTAS